MDLLQKKGFIWDEKHSSNYKTISFNFQSDSVSKHYNLSVEKQSNKITHYIKFKDSKKIIDINNVDGNNFLFIIFLDDTDSLILNDLNNLLKELKVDLNYNCMNG